MDVCISVCVPVRRWDLGPVDCIPHRGPLSPALSWASAQTQGTLHTLFAILAATTLYHSFKMCGTGVFILLCKISYR